MQVVVCALCNSFQKNVSTLKNKKANSTLRASRAVPHPSTDRAFRRLTSEFGWDRVCSMKYGRWRMLTTEHHRQQNASTRIRYKYSISVIKK